MKFIISIVLKDLNPFLSVYLIKQKFIYIFCQVQTERFVLMVIWFLGLNQNMLLYEEPSLVDVQT